jgi:ABC-2 type transport system ATP-binding protein
VTSEDPPTHRGEASDAVTVRGLTKRYGTSTVVDDLTFSLPAGTVTGFLGPNGAGKTTTLRMLLGLAQPTAGEGRLLGQTYASLTHPSRTVGAVLESNDFHPGRSGRDHLRILAAQSDIAASSVDDVLATVGLPSAANRPVKTYSLGMRQRLGLAGALLGDPQILVLDEPANGLDPAGVQWLRTLLRGFADRGGAVLVSSHLLAEIAQSVDRILILSRGKLVADTDTDIATLSADWPSLEAAYLALTTAGTAEDAA